MERLRTAAKADASRLTGCLSELSTETDAKNRALSADHLVALIGRHTDCHTLVTLRKSTKIAYLIGNPASGPIYRLSLNGISKSPEGNFIELEMRGRDGAFDFGSTIELPARLGCRGELLAPGLDVVFAVESTDFEHQSVSIAVGEQRTARETQPAVPVVVPAMCPD